MSRDADQTRALLLASARRRFARDGYSTTTVREIAADAGVNVALINRYFGSKEGLFEACIAVVGRELDRPTVADPNVDDVVHALARRLIQYSTGPDAEQLRLLIRTSGDDKAEVIRRGILLSFAQRLASVAGKELVAGRDIDENRALLNAQVVLATALGIVQLRAGAGLEPLASATEEELSVPLREVLTALFSLG